jgi:peptidyl-prolyl cis-trans isomerase B (cyclophilin B)
MNEFSEDLRNAARLGEEQLAPVGVFLSRLASARRAHRRRRLASAAVPAAAAAVSLIAISPALIEQPHTRPPAPGAHASNSPALTTTCDYRPTPPDRSAHEKNPSNGLPPAAPAPAPRTIALDTSRGQITVALNPHAPCAANSFTHLAAGGFYNGNDCHRLTTVKIYVVQCGDPFENQTGGPGYRFDDEDLVSAEYAAGTVALANSGPNTNGSQFFIVYADSPQITPDYTVLGTVTDGLEILKDIAAAGATPEGDGRPNKSLQIQSAR